MAVRELSDRQREWLQGELSAWTGLGILSEEQSRRILGLYPSPQELAMRHSGTVLATLSGLSALLVGLAVLLLVGYNWEALPPTVKLVLIFGTILATHALGMLLRFRMARPFASGIVFFLGCLFYGAGIFLVAQIFHVNSENVDGLWWWAIGTLPFALVLDTLPLHALFAGLLAIYASFSTFGPFFSRPLFRILGTPPLSVPLLGSIGLLWAYRSRSPKVVALYAPLLAWWVILLPAFWRVEANPAAFIGCIGGLFLIIAECHRERDPMAIPFRFYGALLLAGALIPLSYYDFNRDFGSQIRSVGLLLATTGVLITAVVIVVASVEIRRRLLGEPVSWGETVFARGARIRLPIAITAFLGLVAFWLLLVQDPLVPTLLANLAMLALSIWLMHVGLREDRGRPFTAGVLFFLLWTVLRYVDLFGDFGGMPGAALMFFLCGGVLYGLAHYWRGRKLGSVKHAC
jgi:uncharacterized membrane protein